MSFHHSLGRIRELLHNRQDGVSTEKVLLNRKDVEELLADWERLDNMLRQKYNEEIKL